MSLNPNKKCKISEIISNITHFFLDMLLYILRNVTLNPHHSSKKLKLPEILILNILEIYPLEISNSKTLLMPFVKKSMYIKSQNQKAKI